jgi:hypothetical protein
MATWTLDVSASGSSHDMDVLSTYKLGFYGDNFGDTITVGDYQNSIHILNASDGDHCDNHPTNRLENIHYEGPSFGYHRGTTSSGSLDISTIENTSLLRYHFNHASAVSISGGLYYAYQTATGTPPTEISSWAFEPPDTVWSSASGVGNALALTDQGSAEDHDYYIGVSVSPQTVGSKTGWYMRMDITYY